MAIYHPDLAMETQVNPHSHHSHSHVFRDLRHLATFMQPSSRQSMPTMPIRSTALKRERDALTRQSHDAVAHPGHDDSSSVHLSVPATLAWITQPFIQNNNRDTESPKGTRDAGPLGLHRHPGVDELRTPRADWDTESPQGARDAGRLGLHRHPAVEEPCVPTHESDTVRLQGSRDAGPLGFQRPWSDESTTCTTESDTVLPQGTRDAGPLDNQYPRAEDHLESLHPTTVSRETLQTRLHDPHSQTPLNLQVIPDVVALPKTTKRARCLFNSDSDTDELLPATITKDTLSGSRCQQTGKSTRPYHQGFASMLDVRNTGARSGPLLMDTKRSYGRKYGEPPEYPVVGLSQSSTTGPFTSTHSPNSKNGFLSLKSDQMLSHFRRLLESMNVPQDQIMAEVLHVLLSDKILPFPRPVITVRDPPGIKRFVFDPSYAGLVTLAMRLLSSTFNECLQAAGLPRTF